MSNKTILILLDGCGYQVATENLGYLEHLVSVGKGSKLFLAPILCRLLEMKPSSEMRALSEMEADIFES